MTCPYCPDEVRPRDGVYITWRGGERIVVHSACHAKAMLAEPAEPSMAETLVSLISRMLEVEPMDQTPEQWRHARARNIAQRLINDFEIKERT